MYLTESVVTGEKMWYKMYKRLEKIQELVVYYLTSIENSLRINRLYALSTRI